MIQPRSLSFRLIAGAVLWIALALVVAGVLLIQIFEDHLREQFARRVEATLNQLAANLETTQDGALTLASPLSAPQFDTPYSGLYWQVEAPDGRVLMRSRSLWDRELDLPPDTLLDGDLHRHRLSGPDDAPVIAYERSVRLPGRDGRLRLAVAENAAVLQGAVTEFRSALIGSLAVLGLGLALAAALQVAGGLRPLWRMRQALGEVRAGRAHRLAGSYPAELAPLVHDLNTVLDQNEQVVARARTQAGNLAHSLKTPLAVLSNEATALEAEGHDELAGRITEQTRLMQRQVDYHLAHARAAASAGVPGIRTDAGAALERLARTMRKIYAARGIAVACDVGAAPDFAGERQDFDEMVGNLLDNACKWARSEVRVQAAADADGRLVIRIGDDGPGLPAGRRSQAFDRGRRLDESVTGSGLGLTVVAELADLYGGAARLDDSPLGGLRSILVLPATG